MSFISFPNPWFKGPKPAQYISEINKTNSDIENAVNNYQDADALLKAGHAVDALAYAEKALEFAEKAFNSAVKSNNTQAKGKASDTIAMVKKLLGRINYYEGSNSAQAAANYEAALNEKESKQEAANVINDYNDIKRFMNKSLLIKAGQQTETQVQDDGTTVNAKRNEFGGITNLNFNRLLPNAFSGVGNFEIGIEHKKTDFEGTRDVRSAFITQASIDSDPLMPDSLRRLKDKQYPLLEINGADMFNVNLNYGLNTFNGLFTLPWGLWEIIPKVGMEFGYTNTNVRANTYKNYEFLNTINDFYGESKEVNLSTNKLTYGGNIEFGTIKLFPDSYKDTWYLTPLMGMRFSTLSSNAESIYSFLGSEQKEAKTDSSSNWYGTRLNTPRIGGDYASRLTLSFRYQTDKDPTVNSENGIWPSATPVAVNSIHYGADFNWDLFFGDSPMQDKAAFKWTLLFGVNGGLLDLDKATGRTDTASYLSASIGLRRLNYEGGIQYSVSDNGLDYKSSSISAFLGIRY